MMWWWIFIKCASFCIDVST